MDYYLRLPAEETPRIDENAERNRPNNTIPAFIGLVTNRCPAVAGWLDRKLHGKGSLEADTEYALCLNLTDVQQMQLRLLQGRLTWLALSAGFDQDHGVSEGVLTQLGPTLRDYGGVFTFHSTIS